MNRQSFITRTAFEEEQLNLEVLDKRIISLKNVFIIASALLLVLIVVANVAALYIHKSKDHGAIMIAHEFKNVTYMDYTNLASLYHAEIQHLTRPWFDFWAPDASFAAYSEKDLDEFLGFAKQYPFAPYSLEDHDCDDYAAELHGLERLWFSRKGAKPHGSSFGIMIGDLRTLDDDDQPKGHAMNIVVLHDLSVWGVEPQTLVKYRFSKDWRNTTRIDRVFI